VDRRTFLAAAAAGVVAIACSDGGNSSSARTATTATPPTSGGTSPPPSSTSPSRTTAPPSRAQFVDQGPHGANRVALTFHTNGDLGLAQQLLDTVAARNVVITAFIVGEWLEANPSWGKKLLDGGHELANHTYTHPNFYSLSPDAMRDEIMRCRDVIARVTDVAPTFFRPSGTDDGTASPPEVVLDIAGALGYHTVLGFDVDPLDYQDPGADAVAQRTLATVSPGAIVSMHFGHAGTVAALPTILDGLARKNLTPVTASRLLA
jgi:peptidoglycan/xylan/chitin deacetylase (PgdA/CDA1 family)